ncbi:MAG: hypothetical protein AB7S57_19610 [Acetobacteraceae bacterium]
MVMKDHAEHWQAIGTLLGLEALPAVEPDIVGWMRPVDGTVKGKDHLCRRCQSDMPKALAGPWVPVQRSQLAAVQPCSLCGVPLERLDLAAHDCDERCTGCFECYRRHGQTVCSAVCQHAEHDE